MRRGGDGAVQDAKMDLGGNVGVFGRAREAGARGFQARRGVVDSWAVGGSRVGR